MCLQNQNVINDGELKFAATKELINSYHTIWQKSFYDHIIRDEKDLQRIREYIYNNPLKWELDILNPKNDEQFRKCLFSKSSSKIN
jgi:REP element-mobilizing transposase RayT